jgi:hypothetical protein
MFGPTCARSSPWPKRAQPLHESLENDACYRAISLVDADDVTLTQRKFSASISFVFPFLVQAVKNNCSLCLAADLDLAGESAWVSLAPHIAQFVQDGRRGPAWLAAWRHIKKGHLSLLSSLIELKHRSVALRALVESSQRDRKQIDARLCGEYLVGAENKGSKQN